jgi:hypothetical protein
VLRDSYAPGIQINSRDDARFSCSGLDVVEFGDLGLIFVPRAEQRSSENHRMRNTLRRTVAPNSRGDHRNICALESILEATTVLEAIGSCIPAEMTTALWDYYCLPYA